MADRRADRPSLRPDELQKILERVEDVRFRRGQLEAEIDRVLGVEQTVEELDSIYKELGEDVSEDVIREALEGYVEQYGNFAPPEGAARIGLAHLWVRRVPVGLGVAVLAFFLGTMGTVRYAERQREEQAEVARVDKVASATCSQLIDARITGDQLIQAGESKGTVQALVLQLPEDPDYCRAGSVTSENRVSVERDAAVLRERLAPVEQELGKLKMVMAAKARGRQQRNQLEELIARVRGMDVPVGSREAAEQEYSLGIQRLDLDPTADAREHIVAIREMEQNLRALAHYAKVPDRVLSQIVSISKDPAATEQAREMHAAAIAARDAGEGMDLQLRAGELEALHRHLTLEYALVIFGGDWRYPHSNPSAKNHYLLVEAQEGPEGGGDVIGMSIRNEEDGNTTRVCGWGERVRESDYERVKADKIDNGIIDHGIFARKKRGYLRHVVDSRYESTGGQITRWSKGRQPRSQCK